MEKYPSKVDWWIAALLIAAPLICFVLGIYYLNSSVEAALVLIGSGLFTAVIIALFLPCYYVLEANSLYVRSGVIRKRIAYDTILSATKSSDPTSSPALSLRRVKVKYGSSSILISPKNRDTFIEQLKAKNALIQ